MAQLLHRFDPGAVDYSADTLSPLPEGSYTAKIIASGEGATRSGTGRMIELTWEVTDGPHTGRRFWHHVNYINQNPTAQQIGQIMLGKIALACGYDTAIGSTDVLHDHRCQVRLTVKRQDGFSDRNEVRDVKPCAPGLTAPEQPPVHHPPAQQDRLAQDEVLDDIPF